MPVAQLPAGALAFQAHRGYCVCGHRAPDARVVRQQVYLALLEQMHAVASQVGDRAHEARRQFPLHREAPLLDIRVFAVSLFGTRFVGCARGAECVGSARIEPLRPDPGMLWAGSRRACSCCLTPNRRALRFRRADSDRPTARLRGRCRIRRGSPSLAHFQASRRSPRGDRHRRDSGGRSWRPRGSIPAARRSQNRRVRPVRYFRRRDRRWCSAGPGSG